MADVVFMQVSEKSTNYRDAKSNLTLFETAIKDIIRKIKAGATPTLDTVIDGDFITTGLLADIRTKQDEFEERFDDYQTEIVDYVATDPRADISDYTDWQYLYSLIDSNIIEEDDDITYEILRQIMNNEGYFHERRVNIRDILWYIRNLIVDTYMFGYYEVNMDRYATFSAIAKEDLILDDIINGTDGVLDGGDTTLLLKQKTLTSTGTTSGTLTTVIDSDEILHSLDKLTIVTTDTSYTYSVLIGDGSTFDTVFSDSGASGNLTKLLTVLENQATGDHTILNNFNPDSVGRVSWSVLDSSNTITFYYTVRKYIAAT